MKNKNGFTLVEIMITVAIIGLLASLGTLAIQKSVNNARIKTAESELAIISVAVLQLAWDTGKWPDGGSRTEVGSVRIYDLSADSRGLMGNDGTYNESDWKGPYYGGTTVDPWGDDYFFGPNYKIDNGDRHPVVGSEGPGGSAKFFTEGNSRLYVILDD